MSVQHQEWKALRELLTKCLDQVEVELERAQIPLPHQHEARLHEMDSPDFLPSKELHRARKTALASLGSLANLLKNPAERLMEISVQDQRSAALALTTSTSIPTILSKVGPQGMTSKQLSLQTSIQEEKLVKFMRYLSHNEIFNEVSERIFSHNRTSLYLSPGHPVRDFVSFAHWSSINGTKVFQETLLNKDESIRMSLGQLETPTSIGLGLKEKGCNDVWDYLARFDHERLKEFGNSMGAYDYLGKAGELVDFPWRDLPPGSTLVDVGSGEGHLLLPILKAFPHLKCVAQDRPETIELAKKNFQANLPTAQVQFQAHNFFDPQAQVGRDHIYILRNILHDWCDEDSSKILRRLRDVMVNNDSRLLIIDALIQPCRILNPDSSEISGDGCLSKSDQTIDESDEEQDLAPYPLSQSFGAGNEFNMVLDLLMMSFLGAKDRTLSDFNHLFEMSGLEILKIWKTRGRHVVIEVGIKK